MVSFVFFCGNDGHLCCFENSFMIKFTLSSLFQRESVDVILTSLPLTWTGIITIATALRRKLATKILSICKTPLHAHFLRYFFFLTNRHADSFASLYYCLSSTFLCALEHICIQHRRNWDCIGLVWLPLQPGDRFLHTVCKSNNYEPILWRSRRWRSKATAHS